MHATFDDSLVTGNLIKNRIYPNVSTSTYNGLIN